MGLARNQDLPAELAEAVSKARPDPRSRAYVAYSLHRCPLTREESAC